MSKITNVKERKRKWEQARFFSFFPSLPSYNNTSLPYPFSFPLFSSPLPFLHAFRLVSRHFLQKRTHVWAFFLQMQQAKHVSIQDIKKDLPFNLHVFNFISSSVVSHVILQIDVHQARLIGHLTSLDWPTADNNKVLEILNRCNTSKLECGKADFTQSKE